MNTRLLQQFFYWMDERHKIFILRKVGREAPWTNDKILQEYKFTNPFRQNDRVTRELTKILTRRKYTAKQFRTIIAFRMFNLPETYYALESLVDNWDTKKAISALNTRVKNGHKVFTGAYMTTGSGSDGKLKHEMYCRAIGKILSDETNILSQIKSHNSLEATVKILSNYSMVGPFIAYELTTDLRHTKILNEAKDIYLWANPGPGAHRGLNRLHERPLESRSSIADANAEMFELLKLANEERDDGDFGLLPNIAAHYESELEMRDIEHSLCEFDKYMRVKNGEGRPRSKYKGGA